MRLYQGVIPSMSRDIVNGLIHGDAVEISPENLKEVELDVQAVLNEYLRQEREITEAAKDIVERRNLAYNETHKVKQRLAREKGFALGEESLDYIINQLIEMFFHTVYIDEIFEEDTGLRRTLAPILRKYMQDVDTKLDTEVRAKLKNLKEGSRTWDIEYEKVMANLKRTKKLE